MTSEEQVQKFHTDDLERAFDWLKQVSSWDNQSEALRLPGW